MFWWYSIGISVLCKRKRKKKSGMATKIKKELLRFLSSLGVTVWYLCDLEQ